MKQDMRTVAKKTVKQDKKTTIKKYTRTEGQKGQHGSRTGEQQNSTSGQ